MQCSEHIPEQLVKVAAVLDSRRLMPPDAFRILDDVSETPGTHEGVSELKSAIGDAAGEDTLERLLLFYAAQASLPRVERLPVHESVRRLLRKELEQLHAAPGVLRTGTYDFTWAARIATLRRFTAGPMDWEISGVPRSWLAQTGFAHLPRLAWFLAARLRGFRPCFFTHVARQPRNRALVLSKEVMRSYYRIVRSLELQPEMLGLIAAAWFHDPRAEEENPHLAALNGPYREHGGLIVPLGHAGLDSGVLVGNAERRRKVESGEVSYRIHLAIWPRDAAIAWVQAHPEYET